MNTARTLKRLSALAMALLGLINVAQGQIETIDWSRNQAERTITLTKADCCAGRYYIIRDGAILRSGSNNQITFETPSTCRIKVTMESTNLNFLDYIYLEAPSGIIREYWRRNSPAAGGTYTSPSNELRIRLSNSMGAASRYTIRVECSGCSTCTPELSGCPNEMNPGDEAVLIVSCGTAASWYSSNTGILSVTAGPSTSATVTANAPGTATIRAFVPSEGSTCATNLYCPVTVTSPCNLEATIEFEEQ